MIQKSAISTVTCNEVNKMYHFVTFFFSIKISEIFQGLIKKVSGLFQEFPGLQKFSRVFQDFQGM